MAIDWKGYYLDGLSPIRQEVLIRATETCLKIITERGETICWLYGEIRQTQGFQAHEPIRLERGNGISQAILVSEKEFLDYLLKMAPAMTRHWRKPMWRRSGVKYTILAGIGAIGFCILIYLWGIPVLLDFVAPFVPVSWEEQLGKEAITHLAPIKQQCTDESSHQAIEEILDLLTRTIPGSSYRFRVMVIRTPAVNALAAPGGYIMIFQGLLERTRSAEDLAAILAHEVQHIQQRHATKMLLHSASVGLLLTILTGDATGLLAYGIEAARTSSMLHYSRMNEEQADIEGLRMLFAARIDPKTMISFLEHFQRISEDFPGLWKYLSTHPNLEDRIKKLKSIEEQYIVPTPIKLPQNYNWERISKICQNSAS